jgi:colicin import membrane protein
LQFGLVISVIFHAAILGWALITIQSQRELRMPEPDPIITDLVTESELTKLRQGARTAKQLEAMAKESPKADIAKKEAAKPKPVAAAPPPPSLPDPPAPKSDPIAEKLASAQPPPPPPAVDEKKKLEEQARQAQEQLKAEQQRRAAEEELALEGLRKVEEHRKAEEERRVEEQRKADEQRTAEEQRKADELRKAEEQRRAEEQRQTEEKKRLDDQRKQAELKKKADEEKRRKEAAAKKKREEDKKRQEAEAKQKQFDAEKIAALLNKVPNSSAPPPSSAPNEPTKAKGPALGAPEGKDKQISASEIAMLKGRISSRLRGCWTVPSGGGGSDTPVVTLRWRLKPDGSLDGDPQVEQPRGDALFRIAAEAAVRAVRQCSPFDLPPDKYSTWRTITWEFDPSQMM